MRLVRSIDEQVSRSAAEGFAQAVHGAGLNALEAAPGPCQAVAGRDGETGGFGEPVGRHTSFLEQLGDVEPHHASNLDVVERSSTIPSQGLYYPVERIKG